MAHCLNGGIHQGGFCWYLSCNWIFTRDWNDNELETATAFQNPREHQARKGSVHMKWRKHPMNQNSSASKVTAVTPSIHSYHHPKDQQMGQQHGDLDGKVFN